jgi:hypothetical protein
MRLLLRSLLRSLPDIQHCKIPRATREHGQIMERMENPIRLLHPRMLRTVAIDRIIEVESQGEI